VTGSMADRQPLLRVDNISKTFGSSMAWWRKDAGNRALDDISFEVYGKEIVGIVGESGCGKSTLARIVVGLERADAGHISLRGRSIVGPKAGEDVAAKLRGIQMVFQDPYGSLNPRMRVGDVIGEGLRIRGDASRTEIDAKVAQMLELVGLRATDADRHPHQFSGGQRQRIGIARALVMAPDLLIADEAVSALDVSVQMQILNLLLDVRDTLGIAIIFITHNIAVVEYLCDRAIVISGGKVVEQGPALEVVTAPAHPYTQRLISAVPTINNAATSGGRRPLTRVNA